MAAASAREGVVTRSPLTDTIRDALHAVFACSPYVCSCRWYEDPTIPKVCDCGEMAEAVASAVEGEHQRLRDLADELEREAAPPTWQSGTHGREQWIAEAKRDCARRIRAALAAADDQGPSEVQRLRDLADAVGTFLHDTCDNDDCRDDGYCLGCVLTLEEAHARLAPDTQEGQS
jgi:hypothetical protein